MRPVPAAAAVLDDPCDPSPPSASAPAGPYRRAATDVATEPAPPTAGTARPGRRRPPGSAPSPRWTRSKRTGAGPREPAAHPPHGAGLGRTRASPARSPSGCPGTNTPAAPVRRAPPSSVHRSVAHATLRAVEEAVGRRRPVRAGAPGRPPLGADRAVVVEVAMITRHGSEQLTGVSAVREDARQAVIRATLDAVNRRIESYLCPGVSTPRPTLPADPWPAEPVRAEPAGPSTAGPVRACRARRPRGPARWCMVHGLGGCATKSGRTAMVLLVYVVPPLLSLWLACPVTRGR